MQNFYNVAGVFKPRKVTEDPVTLSGVLAHLVETFQNLFPKELFESLRYSGDWTQVLHDNVTSLQSTG